MRSTTVGLLTYFDFIARSQRHAYTFLSVSLFPFVTTFIPYFAVVLFRGTGSLAIRQVNFMRVGF